MADVIMEDAPALDATVIAAPVADPPIVEPAPVLEPIMDPLTPENKARLEQIVNTMMIKRVHQTYAYLRPPHDPPNVMATMKRVLRLELGMYPSKHVAMMTVYETPWAKLKRRVSADWLRTRWAAHHTAVQLLKDTAPLIRNHAREVAENKKKPMSEREDLFFTRKTRFSDSKTLVLAAIARDPTKMPGHSADFIGIELAKYHDVVTRYNNARLYGDENLNTFFQKVGHKTEETFLRSLKKLDGKIDYYYMFHKKTLDEVNNHNHEIWRTAYRAKRVRKERALAMTLVQQERALPDKGKAILSKAVETDDDFCMAYMDMTSSGGMAVYSEGCQKEREGKLVKMMLGYIAAHSDALAEAQQAGT